jgi:putative Mn2+ efflux pump MntP
VAYGGRVLRLVALLLPLSLDTFAVAAALGAAGLSPADRRRVTLLFVGFEASMPLIGIGVGHAVGHAVGANADYLASAALLAFGVLLLAGARDDESGDAARLARAHGLAALALGIGISLDELAIGFSAGLLHLPPAWTIVLIAGQALLAVQLGVRLGSRLGNLVRERAERLAGLALIAFAIALLVARLA